MFCAEEEQPDLVVIEFAVNDEGMKQRGLLGKPCKRKVLNLPWKPAVVLLFSVFANDWNLQERLRNRWDTAMIFRWSSIRDAVSPQFQMPKGRGRVLTKISFYDMFHPNNMGHTIMADCLQYLF